MDDDLTEELLIEAFTEDFAQFDGDDWRLVSTEARRTIRTLLLHHGVYVRSGRSIPIAGCSHEFAHTGFEKWPPDIERPRHNPKLYPHGRLEFNRPTIVDNKPQAEENMR